MYRQVFSEPRCDASEIGFKDAAHCFQVSFPLGFSPAAMHKLAHADGELATSRAAAKHRVAMGVSSYATYSMEEVIAQGSGNPYAFQVTILKDRSLTVKMLRRAESKSPFTLQVPSVC